MKTKSFQLISGNENGWGWWAQVIIKENGVFNHKGTGFNIQNSKQYREIHIGERKASEKKYRLKHKTERKGYCKIYRKKFNEYQRKWNKTSKGKETSKKHYSKRKGLGYILINN